MKDSLCYRRCLRADTRGAEEPPEDLGFDTVVEAFERREEVEDDLAFSFFEDLSLEFCTATLSSESFCAG